MTGQLVPHSSSTRPGGTVTYAIWVWSTVPAGKVTVSASSSARSMKFPRFTLCPSAHGTRCTISRLPANQAFELTVTDKVRHAATAGAAITLTVTADASPLSPAEAAVTTVVSKSTQPPVGNSIPPVPPLPPTTFQPIPSATITPPGLSGLFPTVTPQASSSSAGHGQQGQSRKATRIAQTSSALPLDPRLIGGQLAGLAVLAAAITMVVARLSLRTPQPAGQAPAAPAAPGDTPAGPAEPAAKADEASEARDERPES